MEWDLLIRYIPFIVSLCRSFNLEEIRYSANYIMSYHHIVFDDLFIWMIPRDAGVHLAYWIDTFLCLGGKKKGEIIKRNRKHDM